MSSDGFTVSTDEWVSVYVSALGSVTVKCTRCGRSCTELALGKEPAAWRMEAARVRLQNFANQHGDCLGLAP